MDSSRLPMVHTNTRELFRAIKDERERLVLCKALRGVCVARFKFWQAARFRDAEIQTINNL
jgi:hypothetical protein